MKNKRTLMIELDGATWEIVNQMLPQGKLPNIKKLIDNGCWGELISVMPAISPKIWTSIFSGKHHEKTGIDFFGGNSKMVKCKRLWDIFSDNGLSVGVFGSFVTWPPYDITGFMIPAVDSVGTETYPPEYRFYQEITLNERRKSKGIESNSFSIGNHVYYAYKLKSSGVHIRTFLKAIAYLIQQKLNNFNHLDKYWRKLFLHSEISSDMFLHLCKLYEPSFATIHMHICDSICHRYWMAYEPEKFPGIEQKDVADYRDIIPKSYMQADKAIGKILAAADSSTNIVLVSDHGFEAAPGGITPYDINIDKFLEVLRIRGKVIVARFGPGMYLNFRDKALMRQVHIAVSNACKMGTDQKLFNVKAFDNTLIVTKPNWKIDLKKLKYDQSFIDFGPYGNYRMNELYTRQNQKMSGVHKKVGIMIMYGPDIKKNVRIEAASIYDISPTVLHLMGFPVASDMDGRVLLETLNDDYLFYNPVRTIETYENSDTINQDSETIDHDKIEERLKSLGYL